MLATSVIDAAVAWVGLPVAFVVSGLGIGLLVDRLLGLRLSPGSLLPLGTCTAMCALLALYEVGMHGWLPAAVLVAAAAGGLLRGRDVRDALRPGVAAIGFIGVLILYLAPVVLAGRWAWAGYNFLNDTAVQFLLVDHLQHHGASEAPAALSTSGLTVSSYLATSYPLGAHAHLATLSTVLGTNVDVVYQGYLASLGATSACALVRLAQGCGLSPSRAVVAGGFAMAANLIYQYALQGSIKEVAAFMALATAAMLGDELVRSERPVRAVVPVGLAAAAMLTAISAAAGPYLVVLALALIGAVFLSRGSELRRRLPAVAVAGVLVTSVAALPILIQSSTFLEVSDNVLTTATTASSQFGQLERKLEAIQVGGVWLHEKYAYPITDQRLETLTHVGLYLVLALALIAVVTFLRRRIPGPLPLLFTTLVTAAAVAPRATPYADAKLLALASPAVVFTALCGVLSWRGRLRAVGVASAGAAALGITASAAWAYHGVPLSPPDRLQALESIVDRVGDRGWILFDEPEEFGKYYGREATRFNSAFEAITPRQARPFGGGYHLDVDALDPAYVQSFDVVITRNGPGTSRPPSNFERLAANRWYQAWARRPGPEVVARLPLQTALDSSGVPGCKAIRALARGARPRDRLVAGPAPERLELPVVNARDRPLGWPPLVAPPGMVEPRSPGVMERVVSAEGGTYDAWIRGSSGRELVASVDGRRIGATNDLNAQGQWLPLGTVRLAPGRHRVRLERPGGGLAPGDGTQSVIGPLALVRREPTTLREVAPSRAASLCGRRWDWVELVR